jgi:PAS domain S-box-containing protein
VVQNLAGDFMKTPGESKAAPGDTGTITVNDRAQVDSFDRGAERIFGYAADEVRGRHVALLIPSLQTSRRLRELAFGGQAAEPGRAGFAPEVVARRKDGTIFPLDVDVHEADCGGRPTFTAVVRDVSRRRQAEEELREPRLQGERILNAIGDGVLGLDRHGRTIFVNPAAARMLQRTPDELVGEFQHDVVHHTKPNAASYPWEQCPVLNTLRTATVARVDSEVFWRKDSTSFPVEYLSAPIREEGEAIGAVVTFRDLTKQRLLERQLLESQKLESIGQLAAGIAHEINTPTQYVSDNTRFLQDAFGDLVALVGRLKRLLEAAGRNSMAGGPLREIEAAVEGIDVEYLAEEIPKAIQQSLEGLGQVTQIVRSMRQFASASDEQKQAVDLNQAIQHVLVVSRNEWKYVADVVTEFDPDLPLVTCLAAECNQVFLDLIVNAADAIREKLGEGAAKKGRITVSTSRDGDWVEVRVQDTGTGIRKEFRSRLFDPFFTTKEVGRGIGQGLAVAHSVVTEKHGGVIGFASEVGRGTTFIVRLPIHAGASDKGLE